MIRRTERGVTLVETLLTVVITTAIAGGAMAAIMLGLRTLDDQNAQLAGSNDTQLIAGYFTSDVASADTISTTGTKSHAAPGVTPTVANTRLVAFWTIKRATTLTLPVGMTAGWNHAATQFGIGMADEATPVAGETGNRVALTANGTSSLAHTVSLTPAASSTPARRPTGVTPPVVSTPGATSLEIGRPDGTAANDRLLAHVAVSGGTATKVVAPNGWTELSRQESGTILQSVIFHKVATSSDTVSGLKYKFSFKDSNGADATRPAAIGIAAYSAVLTDLVGGINTRATDVSPCGGDTPLLLLSWTDRHFDSAQDTAIHVSYNAVKVGDETHLIRRRCSGPSGSEISGSPTSKQTLATNLAPATGYASCVSYAPALATTSTTSATAVDSCAYLPVTVTLSVTEPPARGEEIGRTYLVRATTRTDREAAE